MAWSANKDVNTYVPYSKLLFQTPPLKKCGGPLWNHLTLPSFKMDVLFFNFVSCCFASLEFETFYILSFFFKPFYTRIIKNIIYGHIFSISKCQQWWLLVYFVYDVLLFTSLSSSSLSSVYLLKPNNLVKEEHTYSLTG